MTRRKRVFRLAAMAVGSIVSGAYLMQATGCITPFLAETTASAADFCFIFDCQNGLFGGTIDPCSQDAPVFVDCPNP